MRLGRYHIENVTDLYLHKNFGISVTHKYWYVWNIWIDLWKFHFYLEICRTDWNKCYKDKCLGYKPSCKHLMDCNQCKECYQEKEGDDGV